MSGRKCVHLENKVESDKIKLNLFIIMVSKWEKFFREKMIKIFTEKDQVIDIGGSLRVLEGRGNRYDKSRQWLKPYIDRVDYKILDPVPDYNPDLVEDIHNLSFKDNTIDAYICIAVLEHVENPIKAVQEMYRTLKKGGYCFVYVPFLYYYHAEVGYYKDYWRFTRDTIDNIFKDFSQVEVCNVRGAVETWFKLSPLGKYNFVSHIGRFLDKVLRKESSRQTSGYHIFAIK